MAELKQIMLVFENDDAITMPPEIAVLSLKNIQQTKYTIGHETREWAIVNNLSLTINGAGQDRIDYNSIFNTETMLSAFDRIRCGWDLDHINLIYDDDTMDTYYTAWEPTAPNDRNPWQEIDYDPITQMLYIQIVQPNNK